MRSSFGGTFGQHCSLLEDPYVILLENIRRRRTANELYFDTAFRFF